MTDAHDPTAGAEPGPTPPVDTLLNVLDGEGRSVLLAAMRPINCHRGQVVIEQGAHVDDLFVVGDGLLRAEVPDRHGLPFEVARFTRGDYFGETSFLRADRASATVRCVTDAELWGIPHGVLGDLADRYPQVMRELAAIVARRLTETNLRFKQLRPGRAVVCVSQGTAWTTACLLRVAESAAWHLGRPVLVVDLAGLLARSHEGPSLPPLSQIVDDPRYLQDHDRMSEGLRQDVVVVETGRADLAGTRLLHLLSDLQARYPLVIIHGAIGADLSPELNDALDGPLLIREEGDDNHGWEALAGRRTVQTVLLRRAGAAVLPSTLSDLAASGSERVVRVIPGGLAPLQSAPERGTMAEPWASVDWCARHLIRRKVGVALGAGGSKGFAHLGVVDGLRALGVPIDFVAGCSIGAPIAAAVAARMSTAELKAHLDRTFARSLRRPTIPIHSFLSSRTLASELRKIARGRSFEQLPTPLAMVTVDLQKRSQVVLQSGSLADAMVASMAIPGMFPPVRRDGHQLVDGALLNPVPNSTVAEMGADVVIGVKLSSAPSPARAQARRWLPFRAPPIVDSIQTAFEVMQWRIGSDGGAGADVTIEPEFSGTTGLRDFRRGEEFIQAGRAAIEAAYPAIAEILPWVGER